MVGPRGEKLSDEWLRMDDKLRTGMPRHFMSYVLSSPIQKKSKIIILLKFD